MSSTKKQREFIAGLQRAFSPPDHFPMTAEGIVFAQKWLKEIGEWEKVSPLDSHDAWSILAIANDLWEKRNPVEHEPGCLDRK